MEIIGKFFPLYKRQAMKNRVFKEQKSFMILTLLLITFSMAVCQSSWAVNIRLSWNPPDNEPDLAGYKIYYGNASRTYSNTINVGNVTTYILTNLDPKNNYYITVTAYDTSNLESGFSNEVRWPYLDLVDFEGDSKNDIAVYRVNNGAWYIRPSSGATPYGVGWGGDPSDRPVPGDFDGDGRTDFAVYRPGLTTLFIFPSGGGVPYGVNWMGDATDRPVPADYDGDGKADIAVYRSGTGGWYIFPSGGGAPYGVGWGGDPSDKPVPGDYDGDGKTDIAVYRVATGAWYIRPSSGASPYGIGWGGNSSDIPITLNLLSID